MSIKEQAYLHAEKASELKRKRLDAICNKRLAMKLSSNWAVRDTGDVDFLDTEEEVSQYYSALVVSERKMRNYK